jgi:hypothetical protein
MRCRKRQGLHRPVALLRGPEKPGRTAVVASRMGRAPGPRPSPAHCHWEHVSYARPGRQDGDDATYSNSSAVDKCAPISVELDKLRLCACRQPVSPGELGPSASFDMAVALRSSSRCLRFRCCRRFPDDMDAGTVAMDVPKAAASLAGASVTSPPLNESDDMGGPVNDVGAHV